MTDDRRLSADQVVRQADQILADAVRTVTPAGGAGIGPRETLDREMQEIKDHVLRMGSYVEEAIRSVMAALIAHDAAAASEVIRSDGRINEMQRQMNTLITTTIATQSPVARDLRFLLALDHVGYELERIGDHASSVAKQVRKLAPEPPLKRYVDLPVMGELAATLVGAVLRALVDVDVALARAVAARDDEVDTFYHRTFDEVVSLMRASPDNVERGTRILFAAHYIERIGDRVTNICEDVVFLASGEIEDLNP
ncbi:MAG TPA: phosphate signaling complex protein PhoU [Candidatus Dormibacteraeota bacterium]|nr:phosphate signaling complex protein PhoU [Candidatus Dormibacteraeota bacterium]